MLGKFLQTLGLGAKSAANGLHSPYADPATNRIYNLLFCDDPALFAPRDGEIPAPWQQLLYAATPDPEAIGALADDPVGEGRVRALAYNWRRAHALPVPARKLLGAIVEVPLAGGLDVLAAFVEGGVRYINHSGKMTFIEGPSAPIRKLVADLFAAAQEAVDHIGPWDKARLPPPAAGRVRMSFVVSDGLYFGDGEMKVMEHEPLAAPILARANALLRQVLDLALGKT